MDVSAFLGGPIPPGLLIYRNYKALGKDKEAYIALGATFVFTILFFYALLQIPQEILDKVPNILFTAFYAVLVFIFFRHFMAKDVEAAYEIGAAKASNWSVAGITIVGIILNLVIIVGLAIDQPFYDGEVQNVNGNELYYDISVPQEDLDKLIAKLEEHDFFGPDYANIARLQMIGDAYLITMVVDEQFWINQDIMSSLTSTKWLLEVEFGRPTHLKLESVSLTGNSKYKEL